MPDATAEFFQKLEASGHEPLLARADASMRFDLTNGKRRSTWRVVITKGDVTVSRENRAADCVARVDTTLFEKVVKGETNAMAAMLRGAMSTEGNPEVFVLFQRLFPGPPQSRKGAAHARGQT